MAESTEPPMADQVEVLIEIMRRFAQHCADPANMGTVLEDAESWSERMAEGAKQRTASAMIGADLRDPIYTALLYVAREIGWHAYVSGGLMEMACMIQEVREQLGPDEKVYADILDRWWDQVGGAEDWKRWHGR